MRGNMKANLCAGRLASLQSLFLNLINPSAMNSQRTLILSVFLSIFISANTQTSRTTAKPGATVEVSVLNGQQKPIKGERIILKSLTSGLRLNGRTDAKGSAKIAVPAGDEYAVTLKALADSNQYGTLKVPTLKPGESFTGSFEVEIIYEPAKMFTLNHVQFDIGKATLRPVSFKELNELVEYMKWKGQQRIEIAGHTDNTGSDIDNLMLSQNRAESVRKCLLSKGIAASLVEAKGYGAMQPIADNNSAEGKQKNRRTEVRLID
jgi:outer membrane protein OmpA-like peptidoglycan-associated protein